MAYKIRRDISRFFGECYVNVAFFHLPKPNSVLVEGLDELPIIKEDLP